MKPGKYLIGSDNGLSPGRRQAIIWTDTGILLLRTLGTYFNEILSEIQTFSVNEINLKMSSAKWRQFCLGINVFSLVFGAYLTNSGSLDIALNSRVYQLLPISQCRRKTLLSNLENTKKSLSRAPIFHVDFPDFIFVVPGF